MREFNYQNIVGSVVRNIPSRCAENPYFIGHAVWFAVAELCGVGSSSARVLCIANDVDPHAIIGDGKMTDDYDDDDQTDSPPATCRSCGVPLVEHLGHQRMCAKLQEAHRALRIIRTWATVLGGIALKPDNVANLCAKTLEGEP